ncbi:M-phase phosphoprotein 9 isoform X2 [Paramormyrops kingsleyae]|uniref:M-phase phosphoprotein 9 isoform X2 n=1 Tax=Paramormyrops kingsleyae TaxID=1676925 RepID=UPI000CD5D66B|nr:M-phase phosphoprotein 9 isoform X2 [Paramormyrops kingsleyae]
MSTDDSISEDVSSSGALDHDSVEESGGKESEASIISFEDSPSGLAGPGEEHPPVQSVRALQGFIQAATGVVKSQDPSVPKFNSGHKSRSLCLSPGNEFSSGKSLPAIKPSPLQTLTALVQEIQSSGETGQELWKDSEGRWLQLFQLVEKRYQEQILAQHEQYQCQIQLIQDEIKALVQLQSQRAGPHATEASQAHTPAGSPLFDLLGGLPGASPCPGVTKHLGPTHTESTVATLLLSSGYGTLSASEHSFTQDAGAGGAGGARGGDDDGPGSALSPSARVQDLGAEGGTLVGTPSASLLSNPSPLADQPETHSPLLTTWAQKLRRRQWKGGAGQGGPAQGAQLGGPEQTTHDGSTDEAHNHRPTAQASQPFHLRRSDSLASEISGLTYWRLEDHELYHPLPDSLGRGTFHLGQENSRSLTPPEAPRPPISLTEIYRNRQREDAKGHNWSISPASSTTTAQVLNLDLNKAYMWPSGRSSGFTSPLCFSGLPFSGQSHGHQPAGTPVSPDSMAEGITSHDVMDTDSSSSTSSLSGVTPTSQSPVLPTNKEAASAVHPHGSHGLGNGPPTSKMDPLEPSPATGRSLDDPVVLSLVRQNMREKTSRHIANLRAYYESELNILQRKLDLAKQPSSLDLEKANQSLLDRCEHLERALTEASARIQELESRNHSMERQLTDWPSRYEAACDAARSLQQRLDEARLSEREKEASAARFRARLLQAEEALQATRRDADDQDAQMRKEHKALQDLLADYEALDRDHQRTKESLVSTEERLFESNADKSELKRMVLKLETQIKQLEYENTKARHVSRSQSQPSGAGFYHHPDLLVSPRNGAANTESSRVEQSSEQSDRDRDALHGSTGAQSPPQRVGPQDRPPAKDPAKKDPAPTPVIRALIQIDEAKADSAGSAPGHIGLGSRRPTVSFVDSDRREPISERATVIPRAQRSLSPDGPRSSSLPPRGSQASVAAARRETLLMPVSVKSSPKRCPTENFSTAFGHSPPLLYRSNPRCDRFDQSAPLPLSPSLGSRSKRRLQFTSSEQAEELTQSSNGGLESDSHTEPSEGALRVSWEMQGAEGNEEDAILGPCDTLPSYHGRLQSLADTERLFDELTQEKQQIEAALSRIPATGGRVTLQAKLDEEALEERLEKINQDLGSIRMTLKRFHVLRSSSNI